MRTTATEQQGARHAIHRDQTEEQQQQQLRSTTYIFKTETQKKRWPHEVKGQK